jgi:hypothetical protein
MITRFFGDGEHAFAFSLPLLKELESSTGLGTGELFRRVARGEYRIAEIIETIRIALIGGGLPPKRAAELVATYGPPARPLIEAQVLCVEIVTDLFAGQQEPDSTAPATTESEQGTKSESENG